MVKNVRSGANDLPLQKSTSRRTKLIVGIDYGTTYTGVAFVHESANDAKEIKIFTDWPGALRENNEQNEKTPSAMAYAFENRDQKGRDAWGYEVEPGSNSYSWTKLLLDAGSHVAKYDDPNLRSSMDKGILLLPRGKKAVHVVDDYLKKVHDHLIEAIIEKCGGSDILEVTPIDYWLTVPAIWSDEAKLATRQAAMFAGFGSQPIDEINLVPEPEAAAMLTLNTSASETDPLVKADTGVLVCDCGGGTVDITSYTIAHTSPTLVLNESCGGGGAKCGGTYTDRNLHELMTKRFGQAFSSLPPDRIGPGSRFMVAFESRKHVRDRLKSWCEEREIRMITPWSGAWSAVARGAALQGLGVVKIKQRITCRHYGQEVSRPFGGGMGRVSASLWSERWKDPWTGKIMINGHMHLLMAKNMSFDESTQLVTNLETTYKEGTKKTMSTKLYSCSLDTMPDMIASEGIVQVGRISVDYEDIDLDLCETKKDKSGCRIWKLPIQVCIKLGARQGTFTFRTVIADQECGVAHMDFSGH